MGLVTFDQIKTATADLQKLNGKAPEPPNKPTRRNGSAFDVEGFLGRHGIKHRGAMEYGDGHKWQLEECPFNSEHKAPDSAVYQLSSGALGFKCSHDSCSAHDWHALRDRFEPGYQDRRNSPAPRMGGDLDPIPFDGELLERLEDAPSEDELALSFADSDPSMRYVAVWNKWFHFDGGKWRSDDTLFAYDQIRSHIRQVAERVEKHKGMLKGATISAVEKMVKADRRIAGTTDQWDSDPWIVNSPAGIVSLLDGTLGPHDPEQYQTKQLSVSPERGDCPIWLSFLKDATADDQELIAFLQRVAGYSLTGTTREHALFFAYGTGRNGKGVFLNTLSGVFADYATTASMDVFLESHGDRHPTELARLVGARLAIAQETDTGRSWNEPLIKSLTGGDRIAARFMRQDFFEYDPAFTLIIAGNHKPQLKKVDEAMRARLHLIPFSVTIPKEKRDPDLQNKLKAEWPAILQWCIDGCLAYQREGLAPPDAVKSATDDYFEDQDLFSQWIDDSCDIGIKKWEGSKQLFASWKRYAEAAGIRPGSAKTFKESMQTAGYQSAKNTDNTARGFTGLGLKPEPVKDDPRFPDEW